MDGAGLPDLVNIWDFIGEPDSPKSPSRSEPDLEVPEGIEELPAEDFETPCDALGTSGGTAAFYALRYREGREPKGLARDFFVGKDVAHARDELDFYAKLSAVSGSGGSGSAWARFAAQAMRCPGMARLECVKPSQTPCLRLLLLLENLRQPFLEMRLLDIKLGTETSVAGWKGKSRLHAWKNACVDQRTNSAVEGFRLEGIEMPPRSLEERILAVVNAKSTSATAKYISPKVIRRFTLQRLRAAEFLESWLDVSHFGPGSEVHAQKALLESFRQVQGLVQAVVALEVPQQWIGSSVALALEVGTMARLSVVVKVFDWGRAELTTAEEFAALKVEAQESRGHYWRQYLRALGRLFWELGRLAVHRCCCPAWQVLILELRSLSPAVFRAAVLGAGESFGTVPVTCGMGFFQMAPEGGAGEVSVPLLGSSPDEPVVGSVRVHVTAPEGGVGLTAVRVLEAELLVQELDLATVRVLAFERLGDAKMHLEAFQRGERSAPARGHVCCQSTGPGRCGGDGRPGRLVWEDRLEFSAGPLAREAVSLLEALPSPESWTEMLPPSTASCEEVEEKAKVFLKQLIPWLDAPFPTKLHSDPSCAE